METLAVIQFSALLFAVGTFYGAAWAAPGGAKMVLRSRPPIGFIVACAVSTLAWVGGFLL